MIFVTVGSQKFQFNRLIKALDEQVANGEIEDEIFAQIGISDYIPQHFEYTDYLDRDAFKEKLNACSIVITHGGTGVIVSAIKAGKKVIAVPRLARYGEHVDDHQLQLVSQFTVSNLISSCQDFGNLGTVIKEIKTKEFNSYQSNTQVYLNSIDAFIQSI